MKDKSLINLSFDSNITINNKLEEVEDKPSSFIAKVNEADNRLFSTSMKLSFNDKDVKIFRWTITTTEGQTYNGDNNETRLMDTEERIVIIPTAILNKIEYSLRRSVLDGVLSRESLMRFAKDNWIYLGDIDEDLKLDFYDKEFELKTDDSKTVAMIKNLVNDTKLLFTDSDHKNLLIHKFSKMNTENNKELSLNNMVEMMRYIAQCKLSFTYYDSEGLMRVKEIDL